MFLSISIWSLVFVTFLYQRKIAFDRRQRNNAPILPIISKPAEQEVKAKVQTNFAESKLISEFKPIEQILPQSKPIQLINETNPDKSNPVSGIITQLIINSENQQTLETKSSASTLHEIIVPEPVSKKTIEVANSKLIPEPQANEEIPIKIEDNSKADLPDSGTATQLISLFQASLNSKIVEILSRVSTVPDNSIIDVTGQPEKVIPVQAIDAGDSETNSPTPVYSDSNYFIDETRLGNIYSKKLNLNSQENAWLNKFWYSSNIFLSMEGCCIETIQLYLKVLKKLNRKLKKEEKSITQEVEILKSEVKKLYQSRDGSLWGGYDIIYLTKRVESEVFQTIFKRCEQTIREIFGHKRKISVDFPYPQQGSIIKAFESNIGSSVNAIIPSLIKEVQLPDEKTETELNTQNPNRWKNKFDELVNSFSIENKKNFISGIYFLESSNKQNPSIETIFFEASKFIAAFDKMESLKFYIYYIYYDLKSDKIDNKQLAKTIQKNLFINNVQLNDFGKIISGLIETKDLKKALSEVEIFYLPKRKKIQLDDSVIQSVVQHDKGTVELLNEYLQDEYEDNNITIKSEEINPDEVMLTITSKDEEKNNQLASEVNLSITQVEAIDLFLINPYSVSSTDLDSFCKLRGLFKNQIIVSINENCYEILNDCLIEEEGEFYVINETYYKTIFKS